MRSPIRRPSALRLQPLDPRDVPAVLVDFDPTTGTLRVNIAEVGQFERPAISANAQGVLRVSGTNRSDNRVRVGGDGPPVLASAVRAIKAHGSERKDVFDLSQVTRSRFQDLDGRIQVYGRGGDDVINGSAFADRLYGDGGHDTIDGRIGHDTLHGGAGNDKLSGGDNNDMLLGGADVDNLFGGYGSDTLRGDGGQDVFNLNTKFDAVVDREDGEVQNHERFGLKRESLQVGPPAALPAFRLALLFGNQAKVLDAHAFNLANGGPVQLWDDLGAANQQWELEDRGDGTYTIWNRAAGRVLDADGFNVHQNGCRVQLWDYNGDLQQRWRFEHVANGCYRIVNAASGKVLDAHAFDAGVNGCRMQLWDATGGSNQLFVLHNVR